MASAADFDRLHMLGRGDDPFAATDRAVRIATRKMVRIFARLRSRLALLDEDTYLVMQWIDAAYAEAWDVYRSCLVSAYAKAYLSILPRGAPASDAAFADYASSAEEPEGYIPRSEWDRKRERAFEAVLSAIRAGAPAVSVVTAARRLAVGQMVQGADGMTDLAILDAYSDAGIAKVRFVTQRDGRVCRECRENDGRVYAIGKAPHIPIHHNCRCFYIPA